MPTLKPIATRALIKGEMMIDTAWKLGPSTARGLYDAGARIFARYVGLHGPARGDIDATELETLIALPGAGVVLVQHTRAEAWNDLTASTGASDAASAIACALAAGYDPSKLPPGMHAPSLVLDLEGVRGSSFAHAYRWSLDVGAAMFRPMVYIGYRPGISGAELDALPVDPEFWCDFGDYSQRPKASKPYVLKQHAQETIAGVGADRDDVLGTDAVYCLTAA